MADQTPSPTATDATSDGAEAGSYGFGPGPRVGAALGGTARGLRRLSAAAEHVSQQLDVDRHFTVDEAIDAAAIVLSTVCQLLKVVMPCVRGDEDLDSESVSAPLPRERPSHEITLHVPSHPAEITVRL
jgi:hypothetical protein